MEEAKHTSYNKATEVATVRGDSSLIQNSRKGGKWAPSSREARTVG